VLVVVDDYYTDTGNTELGTSAAAVNVIIFVDKVK
jgi:hypothetical protein